MVGSYIFIENRCGLRDFADVDSVHMTFRFDRDSRIEEFVIGEEKDARVLWEYISESVYGWSIGSFFSREEVPIDQESVWIEIRYGGGLGFVSITENCVYVDDCVVRLRSRDGLFKSLYEKAIALGRQEGNRFRVVERGEEDGVNR